MTNQTASRVMTLCTGDNYMYVYQHGAEACVIDPTESMTVLSVLQKYGLSLTLILNTHHHGDHVGGNTGLKKVTGCRVVSGSTVPGVDRIVADSDTVPFGDAQIQVIGTPGHSRFDVCYYMLPKGPHEGGILWTGDTLFVGGCGRIFGYDAKTLYASLGKLAQLPDDTRVYCGHDYTIENYQFALMIEPDNDAVKRRLAEVKDLVAAGQPTVPTTIGHEKMTNVFLRAHTPEVKAALKMTHATNVEVFTELRRRKDMF